MNGVLVYVIGWFKSAINDKIWMGWLVYDNRMIIRDLSN